VPTVAAPLARFPGGWAMFGVVYLLLAASAMYGYLAPREDEPARNQLGPELIVALGTEGLQSMAGQASQGTEKEAWQRMLIEAGGGQPEDAESAKVALAAGRELGQAPPPTVFDALGKQDGDWRKVYSGSKLTLEQARALRLKAEEPRLEALANAHAMMAAGDPTARRALVEDATWRLLALTAVVPVFLAGLVALIVGAVLVAKKQWVALGPVLSPMSPLMADSLAFKAAAALGTMIVVPAVFTTLLPSLDAWGTVTGYVFAAGLAVAILRFPILGEAPGLRAAIGETRGFFKLAGIGFAAYLANWPLMLPFLGLLAVLQPYMPAPSHPVTDIVGDANGPTLLALYLLVALGAPFLEELVFRGMLFPALARFLRPGWAMVLSGFLFASIHPQGPLLWAMLTIVGGMGAFLTHMTRSLVPAMVMHCVHNASVLTLALVMTG
jgi:membrane protease YdiL (CAAX protease family)